MFLSPALGLLHKRYEALLALLETFGNGFLRELGELIVLDDKVVQVVSQVVGAVAASVAIEHPEEADLRPLHPGGQLFVARLQNVQNYAYSVFVVVADDALVRICCIRLYVAAFLLAGLRWLMVFQVNRFWV